MAPTQTTPDSNLSPVHAAALADQVIERHNQHATHIFTDMMRGDFELDGLQIRFARTPQANGTTLCSFSAPVAYLPYTASARDKRLALLRIIADSAPLQHARFSLDAQSQIVMQSTAVIPAEADDGDIFCAFMDFYQEARPFMGLMAQYL